MLKLSRLFTASVFALAIGSQAIESPANAAPLAASSPSPSLIAYTNTSSLSNLMTEYRKATAELQQLNRDIKSATDLFNRLNAELERLGSASQNASPEVKAKITARIGQLVPETAQQRMKMDIALGNRQQVTGRLSSIESERKSMKESLTRDLNVLTIEMNMIKASLRALN